MPCVLLFLSEALRQNKNGNITLHGKKNMKNKLKISHSVEHSVFPLIKQDYMLCS